MDLTIFIKSISKIAIGAFLITVVFIVYEISLFLKQKKKEEKVILPEFKTGKNYSQIKAIPVPQNIIKEEKLIFKKPNKGVMIVLVVLFFLFGSLFVTGILMKEKNISQKQKNVPPTAERVPSAGIKVYNKKWEEIREEELSSIKAGNIILIGIKGILGTDVEKARLRINNDQWGSGDETVKHNDSLNLFYREYQIASGDAQLKIEAQLYSKSEGWLGN